MSNPTISDFYKYASLATASYVRMGGLPLDGATFAQQAADPELGGGRLPLALGTALFNPADPIAPRWNKENALVAITPLRRCLTPAQRQSHATCARAQRYTARANARAARC